MVITNGGIFHSATGGSFETVITRCHHNLQEEIEKVLISINYLGMLGNIFIFASSRSSVFILLKLMLQAPLQSVASIFISPSLRRFETKNKKNRCKNHIFGGI